MPDDSSDSSGWESSGNEHRADQVDEASTLDQLNPRRLKLDPTTIRAL